MKITECKVGQIVKLVDTNEYPDLNNGELVTIKYMVGNLAVIQRDNGEESTLYPYRFELVDSPITMEFTPREIFNIWAVMGRCSGGSDEQFRTFSKLSSQADVLLKGTAHFDSIELRELREKIFDESFRINQKAMDTYLDALEAYNPNQKAIDELELEIKEAQEKLLKLKVG